MVVRWLAFVLLLSPALAADTFTQDDARAIVGDLQKIVTPQGIQQRTAVAINGTQQWITVRGRDRSNPILLFLHGGPAAPEMPTSWTFQHPWEDYFTVVQWDQRGAGKTYAANDPAKVGPTITLAQMVADTEAMVQYLRATYGQRKIFVVGHSWGTVLGLTLARDHPEWLLAYVGIGQIINQVEAERIGYDATLKAAKAAGNAQAVKELEAIAPYPEADGSVPVAKIDVERKWSVRFGGLTWQRDAYGYYFHTAKLSPDYSDADLASIDKGSELSLPRLLKDFVSFDFSKQTIFKCPIVMFEGRHDTTTASEVVEKWFAHVQAPSKKFVWFENSAHMVQIEEPGRVLVHLVNDVRPLSPDAGERK